MELLLDLVKWLVPAGGLGMLLTWLTSKRLRALQADKASHEAYKEMYNDLHSSLIQLNDDNRKLQLQLSRLERILLRAPTCPHYVVCPIRRELRGKTADGYTGYLRDMLRHHEPQGDDTRELCTTPGRDDAADALDDRPP